VVAQQTEFADRVQHPEISAVTGCAPKPDGRHRALAALNAPRETSTASRQAQTRPRAS